ncbi:MAG: hypothetical protein P1U36_08740 [Legionellaceae bacterium]|nr:hypothetical protein [Legionellaceae bacterium]
MSFQKKEDKVSKALNKFKMEYDQCNNVFYTLRDKANGDSEAIKRVDTLAKAFGETVAGVVKDVQEAYAKKELTENDAIELLGVAHKLAVAVNKREPIEQNVWEKIVTDKMESSTIRTRTAEERAEIGGMRGDNEYASARKKAIFGLSLTTMAIVATVVVSLALAGPSMGTSLLLFLPLTLAGAGCAIPSALKVREIKLETERDIASGPKAEGYAQKFKDAYQEALSKDTPRNESGQDEEEEDSLTL